MSRVPLALLPIFTSAIRTLHQAVAHAYSAQIGGRASAGSMNAVTYKPYRAGQSLFRHSRHLLDPRSRKKPRGQSPKKPTSTSASGVKYTEAAPIQQPNIVVYESTGAANRALKEKQEELTGTKKKGPVSNVGKLQEKLKQLKKSPYFIGLRLFGLSTGLFLFGKKVYLAPVLENEFRTPDDPIHLQIGKIARKTGRVFMDTVKYYTGYTDAVEYNKEMEKLHSLVRETQLLEVEFKDTLVHDPEISDVDLESIIQREAEKADEQLADASIIYRPAIPADFVPDPKRPKNQHRRISSGADADIDTDTSSSSSSSQGATNHVLASRIEPDDDHPFSRETSHTPSSLFKWIYPALRGTHPTSAPRQSTDRSNTTASAINSNSHYLSQFISSSPQQPENHHSLQTPFITPSPSTSIHGQATTLYSTVDQPPSTPPNYDEGRNEKNIYIGDSHVLFLNNLRDEYRVMPTQGVPFSFNKQHVIDRRIDELYTNPTAGTAQEDPSLEAFPHIYLPGANIRTGYDDDLKDDSLHGQYTRYDITSDEYHASITPDIKSILDQHEIDTTKPYTPQSYHSIHALRHTFSPPQRLVTRTLLQHMAEIQGISPATAGSSSNPADNNLTAHSNPSQSPAQNSSSLSSDQVRERLMKDLDIPENVLDNLATLTDFNQYMVFPSLDMDALNQTNLFSSKKKDALDFFVVPKLFLNKAEDDNSVLNDDTDPSSTDKNTTTHNTLPSPRDLTRLLNPTQTVVDSIESIGPDAGRGSSETPAAIPIRNLTSTLNDYLGVNCLQHLLTSRGAYNKTPFVNPLFLTPQSGYNIHTANQYNHYNGIPQQTIDANGKAVHINDIVYPDINAGVNPYTADPQQTWFHQPNSLSLLHSFLYPPSTYDSSPYGSMIQSTLLPLVPYRHFFPISSSIDIRPLGYLSVIGQLHSNLVQPFIQPYYSEFLQGYAEYGQSPSLPSIGLPMDYETPNEKNVGWLAKRLAGSALYRSIKTQSFSNFVNMNRDRNNGVGTIQKQGAQQSKEEGKTISTQLRYMIRTMDDVMRAKKRAFGGNDESAAAIATQTVQPDATGAVQDTITDLPASDNALKSIYKRISLYPYDHYTFTATPPFWQPYSSFIYTFINSSTVLPLLDQEAMDSLHAISVSRLFEFDSVDKCDQQVIQLTPLTPEARELAAKSVDYKEGLYEEFLQSQYDMMDTNKSDMSSQKSRSKAAVLASMAESCSVPRLSTTSLFDKLSTSLSSKAISHLDRFTSGVAAIQDVMARSFLNPTQKLQKRRQNQPQPSKQPYNSRNTAGFNMMTTFASSFASHFSLDAFTPCNNDPVHFTVERSSQLQAIQSSSLFSTIQKSSSSRINKHDPSSSSSMFSFPSWISSPKKRTHHRPSHSTPATYSNSSVLLASTGGNISLFSTIETDIELGQVNSNHSSKHNKTPQSSPRHQQQGGEPHKDTTVVPVAANPVNAPPIQPSQSNIHPDKRAARRARRQARREARRTRREARKAEKLEKKELKRRNKNMDVVTTDTRSIYADGDDHIVIIDGAEGAKSVQSKPYTGSTVSGYIDNQEKDYDDHDYDDTNNDHNGMDRVTPLQPITLTMAPSEMRHSHSYSMSRSSISSNSMSIIDINDDSPEALIKLNKREAFFTHHHICEIDQIDLSVQRYNDNQLKYVDPETADPLGLEHHPTPFTGCEKFKSIILIPLAILRILLIIPFLLLIVISCFLSTCGLNANPENEYGMQTPRAAWRQAMGYPTVIFSRICLFLLGFYYVRVKGRRVDPTIAPIIISNHVSIVDSLVMYCVGLSGCMFVAKAGVAKAPVVGTMVVSTGTILVDRGNRTNRSNVQQLLNRRVLFNYRIGLIQRKNRLIRENPDHPYASLDIPTYLTSDEDDHHSRPQHSEQHQFDGKPREHIEDTSLHYPLLGIFPEGTTTTGECLINFKGGAFRAGLPLQIMLVRYPSKYFNPTYAGKNKSGVVLIWRLLTQIYNPCEVEYLPVYYPSRAEQANPTLFANNVRNLMSIKLGTPLCNLDAY